MSWLFVPVMVSLTLSPLISDEFVSAGQDVTVQDKTPQWEEVCHNQGSLAFTVTNYGTTGYWALYDPGPRSCEYPRGSGIEYLRGGALWIGGIVNGDTLVSIGQDDWGWGMELHPDIGPTGTFRFPRPGGLPPVSDQDAFAIFADTHTNLNIVYIDNFDHREHRPLSARVIQASYAWSNVPYDDFVIIDWVIKNIGVLPIEETWIGVLIDGEVVYRPRNLGAMDEVVGFLPNEQIAYVMDNDGDPDSTGWDPGMSPRAALGIKLLKSFPAAPELNFNWWTWPTTPTADWGPRRAGTPEDPFRDFGTGGTGWAGGDPNKYYLLRHRECDYDQLWAAVDKTAEGWRPPNAYAGNLARGGDSRFLYSFGPYTILPDSSVRVIVAYVIGDNVHRDWDDFATYFDPANPAAYYERLDFSDLIANVHAAESLVPRIAAANTGCLDLDNDGVCHDDDNCLEIANPDQADPDGDGVGDACDNCPAVYNPGQEDINGDGIGDSCAINRTWYIKPDGTGDAITIQAAIDATDHGDTIMLAPGIYAGEGNRDLDLKGRQILITSSRGPAETVIFPMGSPAESHQGFVFSSGEDSTTIIRGITVRRGWGQGGGAAFIQQSSPTFSDCVFTENHADYGGGLFVVFGAAPKLIDCSFVGNTATYDGGGLCALGGGVPVFVNCLFDGNRAGSDGGGMCGKGISLSMHSCIFVSNDAGSGGGLFFSGTESALVVQCTFTRNSSDRAGSGMTLANWNPALAARVENSTFACNVTTDGQGGGVVLTGRNAVDFENCIIAFNSPGGGISCENETAIGAIACCDVFGNAAGDWVGCIAGWEGIEGNVSLDPFFVDMADGDFSLRGGSPCNPGNNLCGVLIGARGVCDCSGIGDCDSDMRITPTDVVYLVDYVLRGGSIPPVDSSCPVIERGDFNCDGRVNLVDVVALINHVYRQPAPGPCNPCTN